MNVFEMGLFPEEMSSIGRAIPARLKRTLIRISNHGGIDVVYYS